MLLKRGLVRHHHGVALAAEYVLAHGNPQVILCERGIRTFETATRNTLDLNAVPVLQAADPPAGRSSTRRTASGMRAQVPAMARAAVAAGADGLIVEVHSAARRRRCPTARSRSPPGSSPA